MSLKLVTLNIEGSRHLDTIIPFLQREQPDVACLQEVFATDVPAIAAATKLNSHFLPLSKVEQENKYNIPPNGLWGMGFFSTLEPLELESYFYRGEKDTIPEFTEPNSINRALLVGKVSKDNEVYTIGTTHFTWSPAGKATEEQWRDLRKFQQLLQQFDELVLCGDFNAPRGGQVYTALAEMLNDHLSEKVTTTLDPNLHYAGPLELVVDTIFSTNEYTVQAVRTKSGISDHQAVIGLVEKVG